MKSSLLIAGNFSLINNLPTQNELKLFFAISPLECNSCNLGFQLNKPLFDNITPNQTFLFEQSDTSDVLDFIRINLGLHASNVKFQISDSLFHLLNPGHHSSVILVKNNRIIWSQYLRELITNQSFTKINPSDKLCLSNSYPITNYKTNKSDRIWAFNDTTLLHINYIGGKVRILKNNGTEQFSIAIKDSIFLLKLFSFIDSVNNTNISLSYFVAPVSLKEKFGFNPVSINRVFIDRGRIWLGLTLYSPDIKSNDTSVILSMNEILIECDFSLHILNKYILPEYIPHTKLYPILDFASLFDGKDLITFNSTIVNDSLLSSFIVASPTPVFKDVFLVSYPKYLPTKSKDGLSMQYAIGVYRFNGIYYYHFSQGISVYKISGSKGVLVLNNPRWAKKYNAKAIVDLCFTSDNIHLICTNDKKQLIEIILDKKYSLISRKVLSNGFDYLSLSVSNQSTFQFVETLNGISHLRVYKYLDFESLKGNVN